MNKALFLDRDGVINKEVNYLHKIQDFVFLDGVFETCKYFQDIGYLIIVVTNQAGIARGMYTEDQFGKLTEWMIEKFEKEGIKNLKVFFCPHHPDFNKECKCRKPNPKMLLDAKNKYDIDMANSILVGDKNSDILAGINANIGHNYLISTGHQILKNEHSVEILDNLSELKSRYF